LDEALLVHAAHDAHIHIACASGVNDIDDFRPTIGRLLQVDGAGVHA
jgi:hypothetical protein